jgi:hypothetical protein
MQLFHSSELFFYYFIFILIRRNFFLIFTLELFLIIITPVDSFKILKEN